MSELMIDTYRPSEDEPYMNGRQLDYFKQTLTDRKIELQRRTCRIKSKIKRFKSNHGDIIDRSNSHIEMEHNITCYDRYTRMINQIRNALKRIENGRFGYCSLTGTPIGLKRLEALPFTHLSVDALDIFEAADPHLSSQLACSYRPCVRSLP